MTVMGKKVTKEIWNKMYDMYLQGHSLTDVADSVGLKPLTVQKHFNKHNIQFFKKDIRRFTEEENEGIKNAYLNGYDLKDIAERYNTDSSIIIGKLKTMHIFKRQNKRVTDEDIEFLKEYYPLGNWDLILNHFTNYSKQDIYRIASEHHIKATTYYNNCQWTDSEIEILKNNYVYGSVMQLKELLPNHSYNSITSKAMRLGLKCREFWSNEEIEILKKYYPTSTPDQMCDLLPKRNKKTIIMKACELGIHTLIFEQNQLNPKIKSLASFLRENNQQWRNESMKACHYKCVITGEKFDDIHHIHGLNLIIQETLEISGLDIKNDINDYTESEIKLLLDSFYDVQSKYPLGKCLTKDIHKKFHSIYGYGNNTEEQWNDFIQII